MYQCTPSNTFTYNTNPLKPSTIHYQNYGNCGSGGAARHVICPPAGPHGPEEVKISGPTTQNPAYYQSATIDPGIEPRL